MKQKIHRYKMIIFISIALPILLVFIYNCTPGTKQIAYAETKHSAVMKKIVAEKAMLREQAEQRMKAGEIIPPRVKDPGYPVANCILPDNFPSDNGFVSFDTGFLGKIQYTCFNQKAGKLIVARRAWYCEGSNKRKSCILGKWVNGEPTFRDMLVGTHETGLGNITFYFKRCSIK
ncbi:MAG: hypothetical protein KKC46_17310 [Proteobacteria bacterium]|nr:hypothetical protein [Pseudomonadota bacterium]